MKRNSALFFVLAAVLISAFFNFSSPNIPDPDSFYHLRHAEILRRNGLLDASFPWTYFSAIRTEGADIWYGFHLLLIPFIFSGGTALGIKVAGVFLTATLLLAYYWVVKRQKFVWPALWPFLFFLAVPNALFQLLMVRPHMVSLALAMLLLSFLSFGLWFPIFLISAGITFFHLNFFWIGPGIALAVFLASILEKTFSRSLKKVLAVALGTAAGALFRPEPISALKLTYIQVVKLLLEKQSDLPLLFSRELAPLSLKTLSQTSFLFLLLWLAAILVSGWTLYHFREQIKKIPSEAKIFLLTSGLLSIAFFLMSLFIARRSYILWVAFGTLFIGSVASFLFPKKSQQDWFLVLTAVIFLIMVPYTLSQNGISMARNASPPDYLREAAEWLRNHSNSGDIVFNTHWDNFSPLFFWNQTNYYIGGMDPIFQYAYNSELYWKFHHISADEFGDLTCGAIICDKSNVQDIYSVLKKDFQVKYVLVEKRRNPNFHRWLELDRRFEKQFDNGKEVIFLLK
ncbi:MAG: hypothetical protein HYY86_02555 [Candidatus Harrisonbacteria bacterium]|nr:hypothetical protein [Candidatus Harrisonbacteria bacterium]